MSSDVDQEEFERGAKEIVDELNATVFPGIQARLRALPELRKTLNPAFPFPQKVRIGLLDTHLVVEYVGPENTRSDSFDVEAAWRPNVTVFEYLGLDFRHLTVRGLPFPEPIQDQQFFLGEAVKLLGDYLYDIVLNPNSIMLNGFADFSACTSPSHLSNVAFLWSDASGVLRVRRFDFLELFPISDDGWAWHSPEGLEHFTEWLSRLHVPAYELKLHQCLNEFIELVGNRETSEVMITTFLREHPEILQLAFGINELNPEVTLKWQYRVDARDLRPDFLPTRMDGFADILEFKLPWMPSTPIVGPTSRPQPSHHLDAALSQLDEYADWCGQEQNRDWLEATHGIRMHTPHTYLIIGHGSEFEAAERQKLRGRRNATIFTYDEFVEMARMQLYRVR